jgi:N-acetyl-anhydromuramyl-L-alanine amidase AmpD
MTGPAHRAPNPRFATLHGLLLVLAGCAASPAAPAPGTPLARSGDEIVVCGQLFHTGTRVVLWSDPGGYDAYRTTPRFARAESRPDGKVDEKARYGERRNLPEDLADRVQKRGWSLEDLSQVVRMFVIHYDVAGTSRACFKTLQDARVLSVHFMLDSDGTIYQTLDLKERAWHATVANDASIGIEIAQIGAYDQPGNPILRSWYRDGGSGPVIAFPGVKETGLPPGFVARPARKEPISGVIHGRRYWQYDFTPQQYDALAKLCATVHAVLPRIRLDVPRDANGAMLSTNLEPPELARYEGLLGHFHVQRNKVDPGPAFDWDRVLRGAGVTR